MLLLIYHDRNHKYAHTLYVTTPQPTNVKSLIFMLHQNIAHCSSITFDVRMKIYGGVGVLQIAILLVCTFVLKFCKCKFSNEIDYILIHEQLPIIKMTNIYINHFSVSRDMSLKSLLSLAIHICDLFQFPTTFIMLEMFFHYEFYT